MLNISIQKHGTGFYSVHWVIIVVGEKAQTRNWLIIDPLSCDNKLILTENSSLNFEFDILYNKIKAIIEHSIIQ